MAIKQKSMEKPDYGMENAKIERNSYDCQIYVLP